MRFRLNEISPEGLPLEETLTREWLAEVFSKGTPSPFSARESSSLTGQLKRVGEEVSLDARCLLKLKSECANCLKSFELEAPVNIRLLLKPRPANAQGSEPERELSAADLDEAYLDGDVLNLSDILREQILLALPMFPRCSEDCRGLCPRCGAELNSVEECACGGADVDPRWAALKEIKLQ